MQTFVGEAPIGNTVIQFIKWMYAYNICIQVETTKSKKPKFCSWLKFGLLSWLRVKRWTQWKSSFCIHCSFDRESCCRALQQTCGTDLFPHVEDSRCRHKVIGRYGVGKVADATSYLCIKWCYNRVLFYRLGRGCSCIRITVYLVSHLHAHTRFIHSKLQKYNKSNKTKLKSVTGQHSYH